MQTPSTPFDPDTWMKAALASGEWTHALAHSAAALGVDRVAAAWKATANSDWAWIVAPDAPRAFVAGCEDLAHQLDLRLTDGRGVIGDRVLSCAHQMLPDNPYEAAVFALAADPVDRHAMAGVARAFVASLRVKAAADDLRAMSALKTAAFDHMPVGIAIVDTELKIKETNEVCRILLARADGLSSIAGKLTCREPRAQAALAAVVSQAAMAEQRYSEVLRVARSDGGEPYVIQPVQVRRSLGPAKYCLLMVVDPNGAPPAGMDIWRAMFNLTESELAVAEGIVSGNRITDIAAQRGRSVQTVRTQAKRILERLNVSSQAEAVGLLTRVAPFRGEPKGANDAPNAAARIRRRV